MFFIDQATYEGMRLEGFPVGDIYCLGGNTGILTQEIKLYQNVGLEFDIRYTGHIPLGYLHSMETEVCLIFELAH